MFPDWTVSLIVVAKGLAGRNATYCQVILWMTLSDVIWQLREYVAPATGAPEAWIFTGTGSVETIKHIIIYLETVYNQCMVKQYVTYH